MNITKSFAEQVAEEMVKPISNKIEALKEERMKIATDAISNVIPKEVLDCFKKYGSCFQKAECATLMNGTQEVRVDLCNKIPAYASYYPRFEVGREITEKVELFQIQIDKMKDEKEKTYKSIVSTLLSLRTFKKVKEQFPEAYKLIEPYEVQNITVLALPIESILSTIKQYK